MGYIEKKNVSRPNEFVYGDSHLYDIRTGSDERFAMHVTHGTMVEFPNQKEKEELILFEKYENLTPEEKDHYLPDFTPDDGVNYALVVSKTQEQEIKVRIFDDIRYETWKHPDVGMHF